MRKMGRKKARVSSHWNPQVPNFSITNQTALISEPILRLRITRWVSRVEKGGGSAWRSSTAIHTRFALLPLDAQAPHCICTAMVCGLTRSWRTAAMLKQLITACGGHVRPISFSAPESPLAVTCVIYSSNHQAQSIFWFL